MNNYFGIVGRITKEIELRYTNSNKAVCELSIAVNNGKKENGEQDTSFVTATIFGNQAENTSKYCHKGDLVGISGIIKNHNWEDKENKKHYDYSFIANKITFLSAKSKEIQEETNSFKEFEKEIKITDEDLPF